MRERKHLKTDTGRWDLQHLHSYRLLMVFWNNTTPLTPPRSRPAALPQFSHLVYPTKFLPDVAEGGRADGNAFFPPYWQKRYKNNIAHKGGKRSVFEMVATTVRSKVRGINRMSPVAGLCVVAVPVIRGG